MDAILLALLIGGAFGAALDRVGATNPGFIIKMLNLTDLHLAKTILLGVGVASALMFGGLALGLVDAGHLSVKTAHLGVLLGGALLGVGFAVSGYCPGTGVTAAATGRMDAVVFVLGGLVGAGCYMLAFETVKASGLLAPIAGGSATLGEIVAKHPALFSASGLVVGLAAAAVFIAIAVLAPRRLRA